ncbi:hypothetical protein Trichorick_01479 (plasmid) [Candidatus Trichorickettsia mobilis]|uniref:Uncharacterized protein n=1 Tax=Candidatus Trichorickettsia mobilis TaxID=1346319 RepID=A0ABZ0UUU1_9RICK|nr:hypothetical protein [Candidatus Trichorickettsia mobilis]WPY01565.1 hypothetical protein Trichorick_01478 [Candidatus Trichorickettsia mobilis]WPY01566.1 hypothetical protein Trichorick_01479 [Candidatus Trichorickettsia mobilis]
MVLLKLEKAVVQWLVLVVLVNVLLVLVLPVPARDLIKKGLEDFFFFVVLVVLVKNNNVWKTNLTFSFFFTGVTFF